MTRKKDNKIIFENISVLDAGAKGVCVAKAPDGKVIFIPNVVPGDIVDVQTFKKEKLIMKVKQFTFTNCRHTELHLYVSILELAVVVNGKTCCIHNN
jgi:hypothetical protein